MDNLKLGYGGTKTEMQNLINDANEYAKSLGMAGDLSIDSFADIVKAIDLIQQKQKIAGTTSREASTTIEGSFNTMKSAWSNLVTGFADPDADISSLMQDFVESAATAGSNIVPAIGDALSGIGTAINEILPEAIASIPTIFDQVIVPLASTGGQMLQSIVQGVTEAFPSLAGSLTGALNGLAASITSGGGEQMMVAGLGMITKLGESIQKNIGPLAAAAVNVVASFIGFVLTHMPEILEAGSSILNALLMGIGAAIEQVGVIVSGILNKISEAISNYAQTTLKPAGETIINTIVTAVQEKFDEITNAISSAMNAVVGAVTGIAGKVGSAMSSAWNTVKSVTTSAWQGITSRVKSAAGALKSAVTGPVNAIKSVMSSGFNAAKNTAVKAFNGIKSGVSSAIEGAKNKVSSVVNTIKGFFPLHIGKIFSGIKLPHFSVSGSPPFGIGGKGTKPSISVSWYKKAMEEPYMFSNATLFGAGEAGDEMLYGRRALMEDIGNVVDKANATSTGTTVYITYHITVDGADDPEDFADRLVRKMQLDMRTA